MAEREDPKVVFLGKSKKNNEKFHSILKTLETFRVPAEFLHGIYVTDLADYRYQINNSLLTQSIGYDNIGDEMRRLGVSRDVKQIEIIIDLDKAQKIIEQQSADMLNALFNS